MTQFDVAEYRAFALYELSQNGAGGLESENPMTPFDVEAARSDLEHGESTDWQCALRHACDEIERLRVELAKAKTGWDYADGAAVGNADRA